MKTILIGILFFVYLGSYAQLPIDSATHLITYTGVVQVNAKQDELYSRAREWFAKEYNSAQNVIQMDNKDKIVGKALMQVYGKNLIGITSELGYINYTISVYIKDGKYKYEISNFYHTGKYVGGGTYIGNTYIANSDIPDLGPIEGLEYSKKKSERKLFNSFAKQIDSNIEPLITSLKENMNKPISKINDF